MIWVGDIATVVVGILQQPSDLTAHRFGSDLADGSVVVPGGRFHLLAWMAPGRSEVDQQELAVFLRQLFRLI